MGQGTSSGSGAGSVPAETQTPSPAPKQQKLGLTSGKPICCCCPDTKLLRDECIVRQGQEHADCIRLIEAHKACLRAEGFSVK